MTTAPSPVSYDTKQQPTGEYGKLETAFDYFNARLFDGALPACMITLHRRKHAAGYYAHERWTSRFAADERVSEIALNPDTFSHRDDRRILSTLVHEMCHLWQFCHGTPSRTGYHNAEWSDKMQSVGLMPSTTGEPGGKRTGQSVTHYIVDAGAFDVACAALLKDGFTLDWQSFGLDTGARKAKAASKTKYTCPACGQNAWSKPNATIGCFACMLPMLPNEADDNED